MGVSAATSCSFSCWLPVDLVAVALLIAVVLHPMLILVLRENTRFMICRIAGAGEETVTSHSTENPVFFCFAARLLLLLQMHSLASYYFVEGIFHFWLPSEFVYVVFTLNYFFWVDSFASISSLVHFFKHLLLPLFALSSTSVYYYYC